MSADIYYALSPILGEERHVSIKHNGDVFDMFQEVTRSDTGTTFPRNDKKVRLVVKKNQQTLLDIVGISLEIDNAGGMPHSFNGINKLTEGDIQQLLSFRN